MGKGFTKWLLLQLYFWHVIAMVYDNSNNNKVYCITSWSSLIGSIKKTDASVKIIFELILTILIPTFCPANLFGLLQCNDQNRSYQRTYNV